MFRLRTFFSLHKEKKKDKNADPVKRTSIFEKCRGMFNSNDEYCCDDDFCEYSDEDDELDEATYSLFSKKLVTKNSFSAILFEYIDKKGISDSDCYKRAGIDRRTFSKIRCDSRYKPSKSTVLALAIALELNIEATDRILKSAGFALSDSITSDIIVKYYIANGKYDILKVNEMLHRFGEAPLN